MSGWFPGKYRPELMEEFTIFIAIANCMGQNYTFFFNAKNH